MERPATTGLPTHHTAGRSLLSRRPGDDVADLHLWRIAPATSVAAITLRANLDRLSPGERHLMAELLDRIASQRPRGRTASLPNHPSRRADPARATSGASLTPRAWIIP